MAHKITFASAIPQVLAHETNKGAPANNDLNQQLREIAVSLEKDAKNYDDVRKEIFGALYACWKSPENLAYNQDEVLGNACIFAHVLQESLARSARVFAPSSVMDVYTIYSIGLVKGQALATIEKMAERVFVNIITSEMMGNGDHIVLNKDIIDMIEIAGLGEKVVRNIMLKGAGTFFVDQSVSLSDSRDNPTTIFGVPVFWHNVPGRDVKSVRFNFSKREGNPNAELAASLFAKGLAQYYGEVEGVKPGVVMELCKDSEFKHVQPGIVAWLMNKSVITATDLWATMPDGLDEKIDREASQEAKRQHFNTQNRLVAGWLKENNVPPYLQPGVPGNIWPTLASLRLAAIEKGAFTYKVEVPKDPFSGWADMWAPDVETDDENLVESIPPVDEIDLS